MDFQLNPEQRMWQEAVNDFCRTELKPRAAQTDAEAKKALIGAALARAQGEKSRGRAEERRPFTGRQATRDRGDRGAPG